MIRTFRDLQKASKLKIEGKENRLAILGNCSTQLLSQAISGAVKIEGINLNIFNADYNQIDAQLLDHNSNVYQFKPDEIILWLCTEKLYEEFLDLPMDKREQFADSYIERINEYWDLIALHSTSKIIQTNFLEIEDNVFGQFSGKVKHTFIYQLRKLNYLLEKSASENMKVFLCDVSAIQNTYGRGSVFNPVLYYEAKIPFDLDTLPVVAKAIANILKAINGMVKKCIILDLDNTLWGGVISEDGLAHIEIGELGRGHVFTNLQRWLKQLKDNGVILAVCSKNDENIAKEPFEKNEDMVLRLSDISIFVANWNDKASNIRLIQEALNIGMDSFVFLDDNPFERNLVREKISDIEVPELPEDPSQWLEFLQAKNYFETATVSKETSDRTKLYQTEFERKKHENSFESIDDYLKSLNMIACIKKFEKDKYPRIAELTQRSNQFNLRTIRYTEDDIERIANDDRFITRYATLKDNYGEQGLVAVLIMKKIKDTELFIDTLLMSCRVLKRGMEEFIINSIVNIAKDENILTITAEYIPTVKNAIVKDLYSQVGFTRINTNMYRLDIADYKPMTTYITEGR